MLRSTAISLLLALLGTTACVDQEDSDEETQESASEDDADQLPPDDEDGDLPPNCFPSLQDSDDCEPKP